MVLYPSASVYPLQGKVLLGFMKICSSHGLITLTREWGTDINSLTKNTQIVGRMVSPRDSRLKTNKQQQKICPAGFHTTKVLVMIFGKLLALWPLFTLPHFPFTMLKAYTDNFSVHSFLLSSDVPLKIVPMHLLYVFIFYKSWHTHQTHTLLISYLLSFPFPGLALT